MYDGRNPLQDIASFDEIPDVWFDYHFLSEVVDANSKGNPLDVLVEEHRYEFLVTLKAQLQEVLDDRRGVENRRLLFESAASLCDDVLAMEKGFDALSTFRQEQEGWGRNEATVNGLIPPANGSIERG